jgi:hypothetical protein
MTMATIKEDYVSFEVAKLLNDKGFNEPTLAYAYGNDMINYYSRPRITDVINIQAGRIPMPTLQMAMKWLREIHHYYIQVMLDSWACGGHMGYYVVIQKTDSDFEMMLQDVVNDVFYQTHEQACEAAIKYCLENLI